MAARSLGVGVNPDRRSEGRVALATVLVVDDVVTTRRSLRLALEAEGCAVVEATDVDHALEAVHHERPNVILVSSAIGDGHDAALDVTARLRHDSRGGDTPILICPPLDDVASVTEAVMREAVKAAVRADMDERDEALTRELSAFQGAGDPGEPVAVFVVGIEEIHRLKYDHGELVGFAVMNIAARRLGSVDATAIVARKTEEAFVVLLPSADGPAADSLCSRMRAIIATAPFSLATGRTLHVTAAVGVAVTTRAQVMRGLVDAGDAMERASAEGRARRRPT